MDQDRPVNGLAIGRSQPWHFDAAVTFVSADFGGFSESASQFSFGMGVGTKIPVADPVSLFVAGRFNYALENDTFADAIGLGVELGISVFFGSGSGR